MRSPEFFIVGAPKCGTTFLAQYLSKHPQVFVAAGEPHYFGSDLRFTTRRISLEEYLALFKSADSSQAAGEKSPHYLFSDRAATEIKAFCPAAKIIIMLRDPVDMIWSLHGQKLRSLNEDIADLEEALAAEDERSRGLRIPDTNVFPRGLLYTQVARFAPQVARFLDVFPREQVRVWLFDDLTADADGLLDRVIGFLGVPARERERVLPVNPARALKSRRVQRLMLRPPRAVSAGARMLLPRRVRRGVFRAVSSMNTGPDERGAMPRELRRTLGRRFEADVRELEALLGLDLSAWIASWQ